MFSISAIYSNVIATGTRNQPHSTTKTKTTPTPPAPQAPIARRPESGRSTSLPQPRYVYKIIPYDVAAPVPVPMSWEFAKTQDDEGSSVRLFTRAQLSRALEKPCTRGCKMEDRSVQVLKIEYERLSSVKVVPWHWQILQGNEEAVARLHFPPLTGEFVVDARVVNNSEHEMEDQNRGLEDWLED